jgi:hypothetical protein
MYFYCYVYVFLLLCTVLVYSVSLCCSVYLCKCVLYCCHRASTQLQLTNISYHTSGTSASTFKSEGLCSVLYKKYQVMMRPSGRLFIWPVGYAPRSIFCFCRSPQTRCFDILRFFCAVHFDIRVIMQYKPTKCTVFKWMLSFDFWPLLQFVHAVCFFMYLCKQSSRGNAYINTWKHR